MGGDGCDPLCHSTGQTREQQSCINGLNRALAKVAKEQEKVVSVCLRDKKKKKGKKHRATAQASVEACLAAPSRKLEEALDKTVTDEARKCGGEFPDFGATDAATVNAAATQAALGVVFDLFGPDLDEALVNERDDRGAAKCQHAVAKAAGRCERERLKAFPTK